ncbi:hypothetical protein T439DRAFT_383216 [Meredithblackwellia eburnea MCA 4105]
MHFSTPLSLSLALVAFSSSVQVIAHGAGHGGALGSHQKLQKRWELRRRQPEMGDAELVERDDEGGCDFEANTSYTEKAGSYSTATAVAEAARTTAAASTQAAATKASATTSASSSLSSSSSSSSSGTSNSTLLSEAGITAFLGTNTGIASWFRTDNSADSTNGHSWCGSPYDDSEPGFAPDVDTMLANFGNDYEKAATAFCGLEAVFTTPAGRTATLYLVDGFASEWVLTPGSIDVITGSFAELYGSETTNKDDVVQGVTWSFTGNRNEQYKYKGVGSG